MRRIISVTTAITISLFLLVISCSKTPKVINQPTGNGSDAEDSIYVVGKPTMITNKDDPMFLTAKLSDGRLIEFIGKRDASGLPQSINEIMVVESETNQIRYIYDDSMRIVKLVSSTGAVISLDWIGPEMAIVSAITSDMDHQIHAVIDFNDPDGLAWSAKPTQTATRTAAPVISFEPFKNTGSVTSAKTTANTTSVFVKACSEPTDADVSVIVKNTSGALIRALPTYYVTKGEYSVTIPDFTSAIANNNQAHCEQVKEVLKYVCPLVTLTNSRLNIMCMRLGVVVAELGAFNPASDAAGLIAGVSCQLFVRGIRGLCATNTATNILAFFDKSLAACDVLYDNQYSENNIVIYPRVAALPTAVNGDVLTVPVAGPFPNMNVDMGGNTAIRTFKLLPPGPLAQQDYHAEADVYCLPTNAKVTLSIIGTDGYTNTTTQTIANTQSSGTYKLLVPGAVRGVIDIVDVKVELPNGQSYKKEASLIFR
jgi:hypothetical protein